MSINPATSVVGDMGLYDNDSEAEEGHILTTDEIPVTEFELFTAGEPSDKQSEGSDELSESSHAEAAILSRTSRNRRYCLEGCDCERTRGRLCECEKRGDGLCSDECQCNPDLCRSTPKDTHGDDNDEAESGDEED